MFDIFRLEADSMILHAKNRTVRTLFRREPNEGGMMIHKLECIIDQVLINETDQDRVTPDCW